MTANNTFAYITTTSKMLPATIRKRGIENLAFFVNEDKPIIAVAIIFAISLFVVLLVGLAIFGIVRFCKARSQKLRVRLRAKRKDREDARARGAGKISMPTRPEPLFNTEMDTLATIYEPQAEQSSGPSGAVGSGRRLANSRYAAASRYGPPATSRQVGRPHSSFTAPDQSRIHTWNEQIARPEVMSAQTNRTSPAPRSSISRSGPPPGPDALVRPASEAPDPLSRQQELFGKHRMSVATRELQRRSSRREEASDWSVAS